MISTPLLNWTNTPSAKGPVAQVGANFTADQVARIFLRGGILGNDVIPKICVVENTSNLANVSVTINGVANLVSSASRVNLPIPDGTQFIDATANDGSTSFVFYADPSDAPPDQPNYLALIGANLAAPITPGIILMFGGTVAPTGFLLCDGTAISRGTFSSLFAVIGTSYGVGDGVTTFNLPDFRDRVALGVSVGGLGGTRPTARALGASGGSESHTLSAAEMPAHNHVININDPSHNHPFNNITAIIAAGLTGFGAGASAAVPVDIQAAVTGITATSNNTGGGGAVDTTPNFQTVNYIIKT